MILTAPCSFDGERLTGPGWIEVVDGAIASTVQGEPPRTAVEQGDVVHVDGILAPGLVDAHVHGGGGATFSTTNQEEISTVIQTHRRRGTTAMVASLVTASQAELCAQVAALAPRVAAGDLLGIHLEGPWLDVERKGAHDPALLRAPTVEAVDELLDAARGSIRMVTLAPELPGARAAVERLVAAGVVVAVGHTSCSYEEAREAIGWGATGATHLFNAMPGLGHRDPGPVLALTRDERVFLELILDGTHLHPDLVAAVMTQFPTRSVLITDAMAAAGNPDGDYLLGQLPVTVQNGVARLTGTETIAGSTLLLSGAVALARASGVEPATALAAATSTPARYLGDNRVGRIEVGCRADFVVLDDDLIVQRVMYRGSWVGGDSRSSTA